MVILITLVIFIILTSRKAIILSNIDSKISDYENNRKNFYIKSTATTSEYILETERFIKDDVDKLVLERKNKDGTVSKIIQYDNAERHRVYVEKDGNKTLATDTVYGGISPKPVRGSHIEAPEGITPFASYTTLSNVGYSDWFIQRIFDSISTNIKSVKIDGKECYEISSKHNSNVLYDENTKEVLMYVEKDTGLLIKQVVATKNNEEKITTCEYKFDCVTDEDIIEPDISQYKIQENN